MTRMKQCEVVLKSSTETLGRKREKVGGEASQKKHHQGTSPPPPATPSAHGDTREKTAWAGLKRG